MGYLNKPKTKLKDRLAICILCAFLGACGATLPDRSQQGKHLEAGNEAPNAGEIPEIVDPPGVPAESAGDEEPPALYSITAQDLPVRELLFTVARDAGINVDVHPEVEGSISINAVNQTLPQILDRIARQADIRWSIDYNGNLLVEQDRPYWDTYRIDYVNVNRQSTSDSGIANTLGDSGTGGSSSSSISQTSSNNFWETLRENLITLVTELSETEGGVAAPAQNANAQAGMNQNVIINAESGVIAIRASAEKHAEVRSFINFVKTRSLQQVLIEATVVEVALNDQYQAGVDWETIAGQSDNFVFQQNALSGNLSAAPTIKCRPYQHSHLSGFVQHRRYSACAIAIR
jgi:general secretion pathway protein D